MQHNNELDPNFCQAHVMGWQEFEKQKPDDKQYCLIYNPEGWAHSPTLIVISQYKAKYNSFSMGYAAHWMPLPAFP